MDSEDVRTLQGLDTPLAEASSVILLPAMAGGEHALAPSLLGEVTHYVADRSMARGLLGYSPKIPLDEGIARSVAWFREHRAEHPEDDVPVTADHEGAAGDSAAMWKSAKAS